MLFGRKTMTVLRHDIIRKVNSSVPLKNPKGLKKHGNYLEPDVSNTRLWRRALNAVYIPFQFL